MLALLLAGALTQSVPFPGGQVVVVAPPTEPQPSDVTWEHVETLYSPGRKAAAVRFCWEAPGFAGCSVRLARPGHPVLDLPGSDVLRLLWTADGKYLLGAGDHTSNDTLRLWNMAGGTRVTVLGAEVSVSSDPPLASGPGSACVRTGGEVARYAVPSLNFLGRQTVFSDQWTCR